ncbi:MAG: toxin-antitoxin system HicB family antitoxin [Armatimonadetes bacterium]|nr:toxin-antitoxin system HicB family antitoxin [Armatimonadota bacterium]
MNLHEREPVEIREEHRDLARQYAMVLEREDGCWIARTGLAEFRYTVGAGETPAAAVDALVESLALEAAVRQQEGTDLPAPAADYSGQVNARLPKSLHQALAQRADLEGLSVNATLVYLLAQALTPERAERPRRRRGVAPTRPGGR